MSLPMREAPYYNVVLPLSEVDVRYRPFLVKEQKNMMIAGQTTDEKTIFEALNNMIKSVTDGKVDVSKLPLADMEYLFLNIRSKSVGETTDMKMACNECNHINDVTLDLRNIEIIGVDEHSLNVELDNDLNVEMRYPTAKIVQKISSLEAAEQIKVVLRECMIRMHDDENTYEFSDYRDKEIDDFIDNLSIPEFNKLQQFYATIPYTILKTDFECVNCGHKEEIVSRGLQDFF